MIDRASLATCTINRDKTKKYMTGMIPETKTDLSIFLPNII